MTYAIFQTIMTLAIFCIIAYKKMPKSPERLLFECAQHDGIPSEEQKEWVRQLKAHNKKDGPFKYRPKR